MIAQRIAGWAFKHVFRSKRPAACATKLIEPDGVSSTWVFDTDAIEVFYYDPNRGKVIVRVTHSPGQMLALVYAVLWRWWVCATWCGWKIVLWQWVMLIRSENSSADTPPPETLPERPRVPVRVVRRG